MDIDALYESVEQRLNATDLAGAAQLLERASAEDLDDDEAAELTPLWEDLADAYADRGRYDEAIATAVRCRELGVDGGADLRVAIAGYLFRAGREDEARSEWEVLVAENPRNVWVHFMAGVACADADEPEEALEWLTTALELVVAHGDREGLLADLIELREEVLVDLGETEIDDLQERGENLLERGLRQFSGNAAVAQRREPDKTALAWFPESEWAEAIRRWPDITEGPDSTDYRAYASYLQSRLVQLHGAGPTRLSVAPLFIDAYVIWAEAREMDTADADTRATYAAEVARLGNEIPWPPGRNDPCWCGSGAKYKKCCSRVE
jgi:tetratricopeptide (TPR) repeat protein